MTAQNEMQSPGRRRVLVVDDSTIARMLASALLAKREFEVVEAADAQAALCKLRESDFDLMLLDISLPDMAGTDLCHVIRLEMGLVDLPIVAYTANGQVSNLALLRLAGFNDFLIKPMSLPALDRALSHNLVH